MLHEDRPAVACPESHVVGLIPFTSENPNLHISQRLDICRLFLGGHFVEQCNTSHMIREIWKPEYDCTMFEKYCPSSIGRYAGRWITEASALFTNGMPAHAFSMILDGNTAPDQSGIMFDILKEEAAWQVAQSQWYAKKSLHPGLLVVRAGGHYRSEAFPRVISTIVEGNSWIRCNFDPGAVYDPQLVLERNRDIEYNAEYPGMRWNMEWMFNVRNRFMPSPPLLSNLREYGIDELIPEKLKIPGIAPQAYPRRFQSPGSNN